MYRHEVHAIDEKNQEFQERAEIVSPEYCIDPFHCPSLTWGPFDSVKETKHRDRWTVGDITAYCKKIDDYCERNDSCERKHEDKKEHFYMSGKEIFTYCIMEFNKIKLAYHMCPYYRNNDIDGGAMCFLTGKLPHEKLCTLNLEIVLKAIKKEHHDREENNREKSS